MANSMRIGQGHDLHRLVAGRRFIVGGVEIAHDRGPLGHSDGDVVLHALCDAILGALALGDIGRHFPDTDPTWKGVDSARLLEHVAGLMRQRGYQVGNVDVTIHAEKPRMAPHIEVMRQVIATAVGCDPERVSVKAKTNEGLGEIGRGEAIAASAIALLISA